MELARTVADAILTASADAIVATDRDGVIRIWNAGAERIFGHSTEEASAARSISSFPSVFAAGIGKDIGR